MNIYSQALLGLLSCLAFYFSSFAQISNPELSHQIAVKETPSPSLSVSWEENADMRTVFTSTYYSNDGQVKIRNSARPINYYNENKELVPIDYNLKQLSPNMWGAFDQPNPTGLFIDGSYMVAGDYLWMGHNCKINGTPISGEVSVNGNVGIIEDALPGIDKEFYFRENGLKYNYVLNTPVGTNQNMILTEEVELPEGYRIIKDPMHGKETELGWAGNLLIQDEEGKTDASLLLPICFDQDKNHSLAGYSIKQRGEKTIIAINVSGEWLNDNSRSYPVVIDPIVTGPTTTWGGGMMPSCMSPTYNQDSILVTIPAGITITELNITASFYADPFTSAVMGEGAMYFSTDCNNSQTFTITGTNANTAGTAYLDYFDISNPLTCCFDKSCNQETFWLSMHLARTNWGTGCNTTYIRYDPGTTSWPFEATVVGRTPESFSGQWSVPTAPICANTCSITGTAYAYQGVPPYTFTHPWSTDTIVQGTNQGCTSGATNYIFDLTIPNCPVYCDTNFTSLDIPPAVIVDACGEPVLGLPTKTVPIKPTPQVVANYDTLICSGETAFIDLGPCIPEADWWWEGNGSADTIGPIQETLTNTTGDFVQVVYTAWAEHNGCTSDTTSFPVTIQPGPTAQYTTEPDPIVSGIEAQFIDESVFPLNPGVFWGWQFGDGEGAVITDPTHTYSSPGEYSICLRVVDDSGCEDSICQLVTVVPAEVSRPNIVTPNNDGVNDLLVFNYLDFYPNNELLIFNRWGTLLYSKDGYQNDWNGYNYNEGTYYYKLTIKDTGESYTGFFQIVKD